MTLHNQKVTIALARRVVAEVAPQELPLFPSISAQLAAEPARGNGPRDDPLGFGVGEAAALLTPVILAICAEVGQYLVAAVGESLKERGKDALAARFDSWFGASEGGDTPTFTEAQRAEVRRIVQRKARELRLDAGRANLLADAVVGSLERAKA